MAKRVKKGFDELLHGQLRAHEHGGRLRLSQGVEPDKLNSWVSLPVEACEALGMTAVLEDVPEQWERVRDALHQAWREERGCDVGPCPPPLPTDSLGRVYTRVAELLGVKQEGES